MCEDIKTIISEGMMKLENKVAIITGGAQGIGKAIATAYVHEGADVVIADLDIKTANITAGELKKSGRRVVPIHTDVTNEASVTEMVAKVIADFGRIDILVNNAGLGYFSKFMETPLNGLDLMINVNLRGVLLCTRCVLPHMINQKNGSIINISSRVATQHGRGGITYAAMKAAIDRFSWGLASEVGRYNIAVNCLKPRGPVLTDSNVRNNPGVDTSTWDNPDMMAKAAVFLGAQDASGTTGVVAMDEQIIYWHGLK
jgi:NAD(P)-dependent dehydrogenase (short-subunit alcohol dehydrogenase family)